jgi:hypothetical protein
MATATFTVTGVTEGFNWTISFTNVAGGTQVKEPTQYNNTIGLNVIVPDFPSLFNINSFDGYGGTGVEYVTWRSDVPQSGEPYFSQYPSTGWSVDIWSQTLYSNILTSNRTWTTLAGVYPLSVDKWSLVYGYDNPQIGPKFYSKGGNLTVTTV